jgi:hypothetical protein
MPFPKPKAKKKTTLTITKVQKAFNDAIRERDGQCTIAGKDCHGYCSGHLECSHFFPVGANSSLRFYPGNAYAQCSSAHFEHHNRNPMIYVSWMKETKADDLEWMQSVRSKASVRYNQGTLRDIYAFCKSGKMQELKEYIEELNGGRVT